MVDPKIMCRQHLLGEHCECHMFVGVLKKRISIDGYIRQKLLDPRELANRHADLVLELRHRGYDHNKMRGSNCDFVVPSYRHVSLPLHQVINPEESLQELLKRCSLCREMMNTLNHSQHKC